MAKPSVCKCPPIKRNVKRIVAAIIILVIVAQIIHNIFAYAGMSYYLMPEYFPVWSKIMMPAAGPPPVEFFYYSIGFSVITMLFFVLVYTMVGCCLPGDSLLKKGKIYGLLVFLVGALPGHLALILLVNLPLGLIALWAVEQLTILGISGAIVANIVK